MLFRKTDGTIVELKKTDYKNDKMYYIALSNLKQHNSNETTVIESSKDNSYSKQAITNLLK